MQWPWRTKSLEFSRILRRKSNQHKHYFVIIFYQFVLVVFRIKFYVTFVYRSKFRFHLISNLVTFVFMQIFFQASFADQKVGWWTWVINLFFSTSFALLLRLKSFLFGFCKRNECEAFVDCIIMLILLFIHPPSVKGYSVRIWKGEFTELSNLFLHLCMCLLKSAFVLIVLQ